MLNKLFLAVLIVLFSVSMAAAGCILPAQTGVMMFVEGGMQRTAPSVDRPVKEVELQPTEKMLSEFSTNSREDWTDGIVILDEDHAIYLMAHKKDLIGYCDVIRIGSE
jgi:hypothetical protein